MHAMHMHDIKDQGGGRDQSVLDMGGAPEWEHLQAATYSCRFDLVLSEIKDGDTDAVKVRRLRVGFRGLEDSSVSA